MLHHTISMVTCLASYQELVVQAGCTCSSSVPISELVIQKLGQAAELLCLERLQQGVV